MKKSKAKKIIKTATKILLCIPLLFIAANFLLHMYDHNPNILTPRPIHRVRLGNTFTELIRNQMLSYGYVDFDQLADFDWTHFVVIRSQRDLEQLIEANSIPRRRIDTPAVVFLNNRRIITYVNIPSGLTSFHFGEWPGGSSSWNWPAQVTPRNNSLFIAYIYQSAYNSRRSNILIHWDDRYNEYMPLHSEMWLDFLEEVPMGESRTNLWMRFGGFWGIPHLSCPLYINDWEAVLIKPLAPASTVLDTSDYYDGDLPIYIEVEMVTIGLFHLLSSPYILSSGYGNRYFHNGEYMGLYFGEINYFDTIIKELEGGWTAVAAVYRGRLYLKGKWRVR